MYISNGNALCGDSQNAHLEDERTPWRLECLSAVTRPGCLNNTTLLEMQHGFFQRLHSRLPWALYICIPLMPSSAAFNPLQVPFPNSVSCKLKGALLRPIPDLINWLRRSTSNNQRGWFGQKTPSSSLRPLPYLLHPWLCRGASRSLVIGQSLADSAN